MHDTRHPRDRFITVIGRKPVLAVLEDTSLVIDKVVLAVNCRDDIAKTFLDAAAARDVRVERSSVAHITKLARNGSQHQGVLADVISPAMEQLADWLARHITSDTLLLVFSGVSNPANVGMMLRSAEAAGFDGVVLPRVGSPDIDPTVIKASAGVAFFATILRITTDREAIQLLHQHGFHIIGLDANAKLSIYANYANRPTAIIVGNETTGLSPTIQKQVDELRAIPMQGRAESLNVTNAASIAMFEIVRQRLHSHE